MRIEYVANGMKREVRDSVGAALIARRIARPVYQTRQITPEPVAQIAAEINAAINASEESALIDGNEISPRTGKPKRVYKRRDMQAED